MKTLLLILTLATALSATETAAPKTDILTGYTDAPAQTGHYEARDLYFTTNTTLATATITSYASLAIQCGNGLIELNCRTGEVKLPKDMKLDDAAKQFWKAVAEAFPSARKEIIEGENKK